MQALKAKHSFIVRVIDGASNPLHRAGHAERLPHLVGFLGGDCKMTNPRQDVLSLIGDFSAKRSLLAAAACFALAFANASPSRGQTVIARIFNGGKPDSVAVNPVTNKIYVANFSTVGTCNVIDGATNTVTTTLNTGSFPFAVAVNPVTNKIYVLSFLNNGSVSVIDGATDTVTTTISTPVLPSGLAINPVTNKIYVPNFQGVTVIDGATDTIVTTVASRAPGGFTAVAINSATNKIYAFDMRGNVAVIDGTEDTIATTTSTSLPPLV